MNENPKQYIVWTQSNKIIQTYDQFGTARKRADEINGYVTGQPMNTKIKDLESIAPSAETTLPVVYHSAKEDDKERWKDR